MNARVFLSAIAVIAGFAFVGALGGLQLCGKDSFGLLWMLGAALAAAGFIAMRARTYRPLFPSSWWFVAATVCLVIGALVIVTLPPSAWIGGAIAATGIAVIILKITTARIHERIEGGRRTGDLR